jgi:hypothetical protein
VGGDEDLRLLEKFRPALRFDSLECLRPTTFDEYVGASEVDGAKPQLDVSGTPKMLMSPLSEPPISAPQDRTDALLRRFGTGAALDAQGVSYGRVIREPPVTWLIYWFFYVDNPCVREVGRHDGDWERVQLRLAPRSGGGEPDVTHIVYDRHGQPAAFRVAPGETPKVFVAVDSHASYERRGAQPRALLFDECDGAVEPAQPLEIRLIPPHGWPRWQGRWGANPGTRFPLGLGTAGDSPRGPGEQSRWSQPGVSLTVGRVRRFTAVVGLRFLRLLGKATYPRAAPAVSVKRGVSGSTVTVGRSGRLLRSLALVSVVVCDRDGRGLATFTYPTDGVVHPVDLPPDAVSWQAAGYNLLRQRGNPGPSTELM